MRHLLYIMLVCAVITDFSGCRKREQNMVPIEQINSDDSNNYFYIFKDDIREERKNARRFKPNEFKR